MAKRKKGGTSGLHEAEANPAEVTQNPEEKAAASVEPESVAENPEPEERKGVDGVLPGMEFAANEWVKVALDVLSPIDGIRKNREALQQRFDRLSYESAVKGDMRKRLRELEDLSLAVRVLGELENAIVI